MPFIWGFKAHRISKKHLQKPREKGGFGLPCFQHYYWAANLRALAYWVEDCKPGVTAETPAWVAIEKDDVKDSSLPALLFSTPSLPNSKVNNQIIRNCLRIWQQIKKCCELPGTSVYTPVCHNHAFPPSLSDATFRSWKQKGIVALKDLYINKHFASFTQLQQKFSLPATHFFRYLQVRNYVRQNIDNFENLPEESKVHNLLLGAADSKGLISNFVKIFSEQVDCVTQSLKNAWEEELNIQIDDIVWGEGLNRIQYCSINARHHLIQFKVLHRLHYSKTKLHKIYPTVSPLCQRCKSADGTLAHLFWSCPKLYDFWCSVFQWFSDMYNCVFKPDPQVALFGYSMFLLPQSMRVQHTIMYGMVIAKRLILMLWKSEAVPLFKTWLSELTSLLHMEKIRYSLSGNRREFYKIWQPFLDHLEDFEGDLELM